VRQRRIATSRSERGQTTAEYVAVTAVAVSLAIGLVWALLGQTLTSAMGGVGEAITTFAANILA